MARAKAPVPASDIRPAILLLRGQRVLLDAELAALYGVTAKRFNEQVKRNRSVSPKISCSNSPPRRCSVQGRNLRP
jgi:hypothetical protein